MGGTSAEVRYFSTATTNSSYSKTYLTRHNYRGQRLLRSIRRDPPSVRNTIAGSPLPFRSSTKMAKLSDEDVMALPMSSDEGETSRASWSSSPSKLKRKADEIEDSSLPTKRVKSKSKATRSSKRLERNADTQSSSQPTISVPEFPAFMSTSQSSQSRRAKTYGKTNIHQTSSQPSKFTDPGDVPPTPKRSQKKSFAAPEDVLLSRKRTPRKKLKKVDVVPLISKSPRKSAAFRLPDEPDLPVSSSTSTELSNVFDIDGTLAESHQRRRSSSTSSLSSLDSLASHELSQRQKDDLLLDPSTIATLKPVPKGSVRCPLCQKVIDLTTSPSQPDPATLSARLQQQFCHTHRLNDAHAKWTTKNYPTIDWTTLETKRIPSHMAHLRQILYRKSPSYYLTHLETKLKEARGNQSKIQKYLAQDIVELVRPGYYGPKGAKVMGDRITTDMTNHLKRSLKADKLVRTVGVSGYVSAVLIPEMLLCLVAEDAGLKLDTDGTGVDEVRKLVADSSDVGMLVWPDDDHVDLEEEEDEPDDN